MGMEPVKDCYYLMPQRREDEVNNSYCGESKRHFEEPFEGGKRSGYPKTGADPAAGKLPVRAVKTVFRTKK